MANENNFNYVKLDELKTLYGFVPDDDQTTTDSTKTNYSIMAIAIASERVNTISGNKIETIGFDNLNESQKALIKRATGRMTIYYLTDGMSFLRSSVSMSGNGISSSINPPSEPDYVLNEVYNLLQQAGLHTPRKGITDNKYCSGYANFNTVSPYDESDIRVITWDSANKTFMTDTSFQSSDNSITITKIPGTVPRLDLKGVFALTIENLFKFFDEHNFRIYQDKILLNDEVAVKFANAVGLKFEFKDLETNSKILVPAINEIADNFADELKRIELDQETLHNNKQDKTDNELTTTDKTIVGGINELDTEFNIQNQRLIAVEDKINIDNDSIIYNSEKLLSVNGKWETNVFRSNVGNTEIGELSTKSKFIVGAINELNQKLDKLLSAIKEL